MRKQRLIILSILLFSSIIRLYKLGSIPNGLSLQEVSYGLSFISLGKWILNPFVLRLPFALLGVLSIYEFYIFIQKLFTDQRVGYLAAFILSVLPWHVFESRVFSPGMVLFVIILTIGNIFVEKVKKNMDAISRWGIVSFAAILIVSVIVPVSGTAAKVNDERLAVSHEAPKIVSKIFINKVLQNYRDREKIFFENLDFGNYFFSGHPRERWGYEDEQKIFLFLLPLIFLGLAKMEKRVLKLILVWEIFSISVLTLFSLRASETLILIPFFVISGASGVMASINMKFKGKIFLTILIFLGVYEFFSSYSYYLRGYTESLFSPRRPVYIDLTQKISAIRKPGEQILVNDRLGDPALFFKFYLKNDISGIEFRSYKIGSEVNNNKLFVDVLPDDPSTGEPLYVKGGGWPTSLNVLGELYDKGKRQKVVIYRVK